MSINVLHLKEPPYNVKVLYQLKVSDRTVHILDKNHLETFTFKSLVFSDQASLHRCSRVPRPASNLLSPAADSECVRAQCQQHRLQASFEDIMTQTQPEG